MGGALRQMAVAMVSESATHQLKPSSAIGLEHVAAAVAFVWFVGAAVSAVGLTESVQLQPKRLKATAPTHTSKPKTK